MQFKILFFNLFFMPLRHKIEVSIKSLKQIKDNPWIKLAKTVKKMINKILKNSKGNTEGTIEITKLQYDFIFGEEFNID